METSNLQNKNLLGIDHGEKFIGLAIARGKFVGPLETLQIKIDHLLENQAIEKILEIAKQENISEIIIGLPLVAGQENRTSKRIRNFGNKIKRYFRSKNINNIHIEYTDESYTSIESQESLINLGVPQEKRSDEHAMAACKILNRYIESRNNF